MSTMTKTIDEIIEQGPYDSQDQERYLDASVRWGDAAPVHFTDDQVNAMSDDELQDAGSTWASSDSVIYDLGEIDWLIEDPRFEHASRATDFDIVGVTFEYADEDAINVQVQVRETDEGFQARLATEKAARAAA